MIVLDTKIPNPAAYHHRPAPGLLPTEGKAAENVEEITRSSYSGITSPELIRSKILVPFVVEATGRLGPAATKLIQRLSGKNTSARSYLINCISASIAMYNSQSYAVARRRTHFDAHTTHQRNNNYPIHSPDLCFYPRDDATD
jgi:hypothetical protein